MSFFNLTHCLLLVFALTPLTAIAADDEDSSRRESAVIEAIQTAGGRVSKVAANTEDREVAFSLLGDKIKDEHVVDVAAISNVIWLNLAGTGISDAAVDSLKGMKLQKLHLEKTAIGDAACNALADMKSLTYLNLYSTNVTDEGLTHLTGLENLQQLHIWKSAVTKEGVAKLKESLPELMVTGLAEPKVEPTEESEPKAETAGLKESAKEDSKPVSDFRPPTDANESAEDPATQK